MNNVLLVLFLFAATSGNAQKPSELNKYVWPDSIINVCWEISASKFVVEKTWVEQAIKETWGKESGINFACWCECQSNSDGIHIGADDTRPSTNGKFGKQLDRQTNGMVLNFTYKKTQIPVGIKNIYNIKELDFQNVKPITEQDRKRFIKATAIHEFGHALGLTHQNDRNDCSFKGCFFDNNAVIQGALWFTPCDEYSVMNYCSNSYLNDGYLSELDAVAIRTLYPYKDKIPRKTPLYLVYTNDVTKVKDRANAPQMQGNPNQYKILAKDIIIYLGGDPQLLKNIESVRFRPHRGTLKEKVITGPQNLYYQVYRGIWGSFTERVDVTFKDGNSTVLTQEIDPKVSYVDGKVKKPLIDFKRRGPNKDGSIRQ